MHCKMFEYLIFQYKYENQQIFYGKFKNLKI